MPISLPPALFDSGKMEGFGDLGTLHEPEDFNNEPIPWDEKPSLDPQVSDQSMPKLKNGLVLGSRLNNETGPASKKSFNKQKRKYKRKQLILILLMIRMILTLGDWVPR